MNDERRARRPIRVSDAERDAAARILVAALAEGRLTAAEAEERIAACYVARYDRDLDELLRDMPQWNGRGYGTETSQEFRESCPGEREIRNRRSSFIARCSHG